MPQSKHNRPENSPECFTPLTSFPSSHQCLVNLVAVVRGWFSGRNRDHREMSRRNKPHSQTPWQAVVCRWRLRLPVCAPPPLPRAPDAMALGLVFQMCQRWGGNRLHTWVFCVCLSLIICGEYCPRALRGLNSGLLFGAIWQTQTGKGVTQILTPRFCEGQEIWLPFYLWALHACSSSRRMCHGWQWADHMVYLWTFAWITSKYHLI